MIDNIKVIKITLQLKILLSILLCSKYSYLVIFIAEKDGENDGHQAGKTNETMQPTSTDTTDADNHYRPQGLDLPLDSTVNEPAGYQCTSPNKDPIKPFTFQVHVINDNELYKASPEYLLPETSTKHFTLV